MSQELIKKCYKNVANIIDKKYFTVTSQKLESKLKDEKLIIKTKLGYRFSKKALKFVPTKMYYYNSVVGILHEYYFAKGVSNNIQNLSEYNNSINKAFLKYNYAPPAIKERLSTKFESIMEQGVSVKHSENADKVYLNGKGSSEFNVPSQSDVIIEDSSGKQVGISLKAHSNNSNSGLINSSPVTLIGEYTDLSYIKDYETSFLNKFNFDSKSEVKKFSKENSDFKSICSDHSKEIFSIILKNIKEVLEKEDMHEILLKTLRLKKNSKGSQLTQDELRDFNDIYDDIISLKKNIVIKTGTTIIIDNLLKLRLKYSNGNMGSSIKLQMDLLTRSKNA